MDKKLMICISELLELSEISSNIENIDIDIDFLSELTIENVDS